MVARAVRHDATSADLGDSQAGDQLEEGVVRAAGFEGADFLEVFRFEVEGEGGGGGGGFAREGAGGDAVEGCAGEEGGSVDVGGYQGRGGAD